MPIEGRFMPSFIVAYITSKRELSGMDQHMSNKRTFGISSVLTVVTRKLIFLRMS